MKKIYLLIALCGISNANILASEQKNETFDWRKYVTEKRQNEQFEDDDMESKQPTKKRRKLSVKEQKAVREEIELKRLLQEVDERWAENRANGALPGRITDLFSKDSK